MEETNRYAEYAAFILVIRPMIDGRAHVLLIDDAKQMRRARLEYQRIPRSDVLDGYVAQLTGDPSWSPKLA